MGFLLKLVDRSLLFNFFLIVAVGTFHFNAHVCLPHLVPSFPGFVKDVMNWFVREVGDYLVVEKPSFYVGVLWIELVVQWPLSFVCLYGIVTSKSWLPTICLIYGVCTSTSAAVSLAELWGSGRASGKMMAVYSTFFGFGVLAALRGLVPYFSKANGVGDSSALNRKKRA